MPDDDSFVPDGAEEETAAAKLGRPEFVFDLDRLTALCQVHATDQEIAHHFGCSTRTLERRRQKDPEFAACFEKARADGKISLRRAQWKEALNGNSTMQIWLGKQELGQVDRVEHSGPQGGPIRLSHVRQALENLSEEDFQALAKEHGLELPLELVNDRDSNSPDDAA
jgi:hypothetical protein